MTSKVVETNINHVFLHTEMGVYHLALRLLVDIVLAQNTGWRQDTRRLTTHLNPSSLTLIYSYVIITNHS